MPTLRYWMETEVHVYAFSIAANVLLSFFPFLIVMVTLCRYVLQWPGAEQAIFFALNDYFPGEVGEFVSRNLKAEVAKRGPVQIVSVLLLFFTANGIFEPLEVALNRAWGIPVNRSYFRNQLISLGLIFLCGALVLLSAVFTAANREALTKMAIMPNWPDDFLGTVVFKTAAIPISILLLFLVYWVLPNRRLRARDLIPVSIAVGLGLELLKYINLWTLPWLRMKLQNEYGPFINSVTIILWSFLAALIVLAGAEWSARRRGAFTPPQPVLPAEPSDLRSAR
ncbi:MAG TPA: YihY/virulence factor BrkB family protein [Burkholderiales bacterium]|nr:YihY/virulence factor BrkB family protein [Burkholderiales bacterium]